MISKTFRVPKLQRQIDGSSGMSAIFWRRPASVQQCAEGVNICFKSNFRRAKDLD